MAKRLKVLAIKSGLRCQLTGGVGTLQVYETKCQDSQRGPTQQQQQRCDKQVESDDSDLSRNPVPPQYRKY